MALSLHDYLQAQQQQQQLGGPHCRESQLVSLSWTKERTVCSLPRHRAEAQNVQLMYIRPSHIAERHQGSGVIYVHGLFIATHQA